MLKKFISHFLLIVTMVAYATMANAEGLTEDKQAIEALIQEYTVDWNSHDVHQLSQIFTYDVGFVTVTGLWLKNRDEFYKAHEQLHQTTYKHSIMTAENSTIEIINDNLALAHWYWQMQGVENADGTVKPTYKGLFTWVLIKENEKWQVRASHNSIM